MPQTRCPWCREPLEQDRDVPLEFCLTCDAWLHAECVAPHAVVQATPEGEWTHAGDAC